MLSKQETCTVNRRNTCFARHPVSAIHESNATPDEFNQQPVYNDNTAEMIVVDGLDDPLVAVIVHCAKDKTKLDPGEAVKIENLVLSIKTAQLLILLGNTVCDENGFCLLNVSWLRDSMSRTMSNSAQDCMDQALKFENNHERFVVSNEYELNTLRRVVRIASIRKNPMEINTRP